MSRTFLLLLITGCALFANGSPTVNNDDSCDVIIAPAATLLSPNP